MKKALRSVAVIFSIIVAVSAAATAAMFGLNMYLSNNHGYILGKTMYGGELIERVGFGVLLSDYCPLSTPGDTDYARTYISFHPESLISSFFTFLAAGCIISCIIYFVCRFIRSKKKTAEQD